MKLLLYSGSARLYCFTLYQNVVVYIFEFMEEVLIFLAGFMAFWELLGGFRLMELISFPRKCE